MSYDHSSRPSHRNRETSKNTAEDRERSSQKSEQQAAKGAHYEKRVSVVASVSQSLYKPVSHDLKVVHEFQ